MLATLLSPSASGQIQLDRFFPPVVAAGQDSQVTVEGKFPTWPVAIHTDGDDVQINPQEKSGQIKVTLPSDAPPGLRWIRFSDEKSASKLAPLLVSPIPVSIEKEPNDKRADANQFDLPAVLAGRLAKRGDSDAYRVAVKAGEQLVVSVTANQVLKAPMDAVLQLTDLRGNVLLQSDDARGLDPQLVYRCKQDGELLIRIFAFPETPNSTVGFGGSTEFVYVIEVTTGAFVDHVAVTRDGPLAFGYNLPEDGSVSVSTYEKRFPAVASMAGALGWSWVFPRDDGDSPIQYGDAHAGGLPLVQVGHIRQQNESHSISITVQKGKKYRAEVRSKVDGFLLDSKLEVFDPKSDTVLASNDDVSRGGYDAGVDFTAKSDGRLEVRLTEMLDAFGPRHFYQLTIREQQADFSLSVASDRFILDEKASLEIPVTVTRLAGFNRPIRIEAIDLPAGVSSEPVISEPKGDTAKSVKLKLSGQETADQHATFRIVGNLVDEDVHSMPAAREANFAIRPSFAISSFWLTVTGQTQQEKK